MPKKKKKNQTKKKNNPLELMPEIVLPVGRLHQRQGEPPTGRLVVGVE